MAKRTVNNSTDMETSCSQISCCHVGVGMELSEIKQEIKGLKTMVDFAVRLLTKLVPPSTDDFRNILNGSTGLTITPVPTIVTNEADRLEVEVVQEPMEVEEEEEDDDEEEETVELKISIEETENQNECTDGDPADADHVDSETSDGDPTDADHVDSETSESSPSNQPSRTTSPISSSISQTGTSTPPMVDVRTRDANDDSSQEIPSAKEDCVDAALGTVPVQSPEPLHESTNTFTSSKPTSESTEISYIPEDSSYIVKEPSIPCALESRLSSSISISLEETHTVESDKTRCDTNKELSVRVCSPDERDEHSKPEFEVVHEADLVQDPPIISIDERADKWNGEIEELNLGNVKVKEEVPSEYDENVCTSPIIEEEHIQQDEDVKMEPEGMYLGDGMLPVCVLMKREDEDNISLPIDGCEESNPYQIYSELSPERYPDQPAESEVNEVPPQLPASPLKPLFGSALVSKLKQKIQEKIQAAVGTVIEDPINENDNSLNAKRCINVSLAFDSNSDSKQIMVTESKLRPKFYQCKICAKVFFCTIALHAHKNNCNGMRKQYHCNSCPLIFKSRAVLCNHRRLHAKKKSKNRHKCDACGREFILKSTLKKHRQSEICLGTRMKCYKKLPQYFCSECGEGFLNSTNLALHQKLHEVDKNAMTNATTDQAKKQVPAPNRTVRRYPCGYCNESFIDKRSVTLHEKLHTDKEFAAFDQQRRMIQRRHQLMMLLQKQQEESAKKQYGCTVCGRCYPIELLLDMHTRLHHAIS